MKWPLKNFNICKIVSFYGRIITEVVKYLQCSTTIFSSSFQKIPFILKTVEADATWHLALSRRTFPDKKYWDWQGWGSLSDINRFILKGLQGQIHSEVKISFQFFIIDLVSVYFKFHNHFNYSQLWQKFRKEKNLLFQVNFSPLYV